MGRPPSSRTRLPQPRSARSTGLRIDLGSSNARKQGYVALDIDPSVRPDIVADFNKLPLPIKSGLADEVHATQVAEHLSIHLIDFLREVHRLLRPGGALTLTLPNMFSLKNRILYLAGRIADSREWHPHHLKLIPPTYLYGLLRHLGFDPRWDYKKLAWLPARHLLAGSLCIRARKRA